MKRKYVEVDAVTYIASFVEQAMMPSAFLFASVTTMIIVMSFKGIKKNGVGWKQNGALTNTHLRRVFRRAWFQKCAVNISPLSYCN